MQVLPLALSAAAALAVAPGLRKGLLDGGHTVQNYRGQPLACPLGMAIVVAVALTAGALGLLVQAGAIDRATVTGLTFVLGVAALGLFDDAYSGPSRGWRGHGSVVRGGALPTGAVKAIGTLALAGWVAGRLVGGDDAAADTRWVLVVLVLALATNLFNIIDLRPGRAVKVFVLVTIGAAVAVGTDLLDAFGAYIGAILVVGVYDLRERGMLGDTGANLVGAVAGLMLVTAITSTAGLAVCAAVLLAVTAYGEYRSLSAFVERTPGFRHLDSMGRLHNPRKDAAA